MDKLLFNKRKRVFKRYSRRAGQYGPLIVEILKDFDLPKDLIFLAMANRGFGIMLNQELRQLGFGNLCLKLQRGLV